LGQFDWENLFKILKNAMKLAFGKMMQHWKYMNNFHLLLANNCSNNDEIVNNIASFE